MRWSDALEIHSNVVVDDNAAGAGMAKYDGKGRILRVRRMGRLIPASHLQKKRTRTPGIAQSRSFTPLTPSRTNVPRGPKHAALRMTILWFKKCAVGIRSARWKRNANVVDLLEIFSNIPIPASVKKESSRRKR